MMVEHIVSIISALTAIVATVIAVREARAKAKQAKQHAAETRQYAAALNTVIKYGQYMKYLEGADENIGQAARHLGELAEESKEVVGLASKEIRDSVCHLRSLTASADSVARDLRTISAVTLRAQRDSLRAHRELLRQEGLLEPGGEDGKQQDEKPEETA